MRLKFGIWLFLGFLCGYLNANDETKIVIAEGIGINAQKATQNAAYNAMLQTVGVVIDAKTQAEQMSVIRDGILEQSEQFSSTVSEYSQGFLENLTVMEVAERDGLFAVTAEVTIRMKAFSTYLQAFAKGEAEIEGGGLFATVQNRLDQRDSLWELVKAWLEKIKNGELTEIKVGKPQLASDVWQDIIPMYPALQNYKGKAISEKQRGLTEEETFIFIPIEIMLKENLLIELETLLSELAMDKKPVLNNSDIQLSANDGMLFLKDVGKPRVTQYILKDLNDQFGDYTSDPSGNLGTKLKNSVLVFKILDRSGLTLYQEFLYGGKGSQNYLYFDEPDNYQRNYAKGNNLKIFETWDSDRWEGSIALPWGHLGAVRFSNNEMPIIICTERKFGILARVSLDILAKADRIEVFIQEDDSI